MRQNIKVFYLDMTIIHGFFIIYSFLKAKLQYNDIIYFYGSLLGILVSDLIILIIYIVIKKWKKLKRKRLK